MEYQHSVSLDIEKCKGCTSCVHHCPTEAIRIRDRHAVIDPMRCIDCGECIRICPHQAKIALRDDLLDLQRFKWKIALPAPSLYAQFNNLDDVDFVLQGLLDIGFDDIFEVSRGAELVTARTRQYLKLRKGPRPVISSACPAIVRLIGLRFPSLKENILDLLPPMEIAAAMAREQALKDHPEFKKEDIGVCFISPCPAKMSYVKNGLPGYKSQVDVVVGFKDVYFLLINEMKYSRRPKTLSESGMIGIGWAASGGEAMALFNDAYLAADGIDNCIRVLDRIEGGDFPNLEFVELNACPGGCVGGAMTMQDPFIAKARLQTLRRFMPVSQNFVDEKEAIPESYFVKDMGSYTPLNRLSDNMAESMRMLKEIRELKEELPGFDCGACGAPTCRAFAEDVVKGNASKYDCVLTQLEDVKAYLKEHEGKA